MASVVEIDENTIQVIVSLGYRPDGTKKRRKKTFHIDPQLTKKQKEKEKSRLVYEYEKEVKNNEYLEKDLRFIDYSKKFMEEYARKELSITTCERYDSLLEKINLEIGNMRLSEIKPPHIAELKKKIAKMTKKVPLRDEKGKIISYEKKTIAPKTQLHYFRLVSSILSRAVNEFYISDNPCSKVKAPKVPKKEFSLLDIETIKQMTKYLEEEPIQYNTIINTLLYVGLRRGEALALTWDDVQLTGNKILKVTKTAQYIAKKGIIIKEPKTPSSVREIVLSDGIIDILKKWKKAQSIQRLKAGEQWEDNNYIFTQWNGKIMHPDTVSSYFANFMKKYDLPQVSLHSLRKANITLQLYMGVDPKTASVRAGHSNIGVTMNIYAYMQESSNKFAAKMLDEALS